VVVVVVVVVVMMMMMVMCPSSGSVQSLCFTESVALLMYRLSCWGCLTESQAYGLVGVLTDCFLGCWVD
jgi:hypothetical protein